MIDFNRPAFTGKEFEYIRDAVERNGECSAATGSTRRNVLHGWKSAFMWVM